MPSNRIPKSERRLQILSCATELFSVKGFEETTMDDIALSADITKRTLYRYFSTKDELLYSIHDKFSRTSLVADVLSQTDDPVEQFTRIISRHVEIVTSQKTEIAVFYDEWKHLSPAEQRKASRRWSDYENFAIDVLTAGQRQGLFTDIDARIAARAALGSLTETYRWYEPGGRLTPAQLAAESAALFLGGAAAPTADWPAIAAAAAAGESRRRPERQVATARDNVLEAAVRSFAAVGYRSSSIRELADRADITKGAVMYHARYKHSLLEEINVRAFERGIEAFEQAVQAGGSPAVVFTRIISAQMSFLGTHVPDIVVVNENIRYLEPAARRKVKRLRQRWLGLFDDVVDAGISHGDLVFHDPDLLSRLLVGMLNSTYRWYRPGGRLSTRQIASAYSRLLLFGLSPDRGRGLS
jgi:AcrR family transcriptional regulator